MYKKYISESQHRTKHYEGKRFFPGTNLRDPSVLIPRSQNQIISIRTGTTILAANICRQTRMFLKCRAKTRTLQYRKTSSSPRTFQARNAAYERKINLQHCETSQTPEEAFFDKITFLDKGTFLEDQTVIHTNIFSNTYSSRRLKTVISTNKFVDDHNKLLTS